jgi:glycosyltransferase involved in cell wall biosynthesis
MKDAQLSIIVPIFKMSGKLDYLFSWLREIDNLSAEVQVILVVDSVDQVTSEEVEKFCNNLSNFSGCVVKGNFNSPGNSRNAGLSYCTGRWVAFWDSDDIPNVWNALETLKTPVSIDCDLIIGSYQIKDLSSGATITKACFQPETREFILDVGLQPGLWRFLIKRELAINERFPPSKMGEDQIYLTRIFAKVRNVFISEKSFYTYHRNFPGQLTSNTLAKKELSQTVALIDTSPYPREDLSLIRTVMLRKILITALWNCSWSSKYKLIETYLLLQLVIKRNSIFTNSKLHFPWIIIAKETWKRHSN